MKGESSVALARRLMPKYRIVRYGKIAKFLVPKEERQAYVKALRLGKPTWAQFKERDDIRTYVWSAMEAEEMLIHEPSDPLPFLAFDHESEEITYYLNAVLGQIKKPKTPRRCAIARSPCSLRREREMPLFLSITTTPHCVRDVLGGFPIPSPNRLRRDACGVLGGCIS